MRIPHDSYVLVADGAKMLFFRNEGDSENPNLQVIDAEQQTDPADQDIKTDAAGRMPGGESALEPDYHQQAEDRFAAEAAARINRAALANEFEQLIIVAPPKTLGQLRKHIHKQAESRIVAEIPKDLTSHPVDRIEQALQDYDKA